MADNRNSIICSVIFAILFLFQSESLHTTMTVPYQHVHQNSSLPLPCFLFLSVLCLLRPLRTVEYVLTYIFEPKNIRTATVSFKMNTH